MKKSGFYIGLMIFAFLAMTACQLDTNPIPASEFGIRTTVPEEMVVPFPIPQNPTPEELGTCPRPPYRSIRCLRSHDARRSFNV